MKISQIFIFMYNYPMSKIKDATTQFHFNKLDEDEVIKWAKDLVINKVSMQIWNKGGEENPQKFLPNKYEPKEKRLWLGAKSSIFKKDTPSNLVGAEIFLKAEWENVYLFGQTALKWDEKEKSHYINLEGEFFKSQQRIQLRIEAIPKFGITIKIVMEDKEYECFDISFGGTSFFSDEEFAVGQMMEKFDLILEKETFFVPRAKVVKIIDIDDEDREGQKMIAINFVKLRHDTEVNLTKKVEAMKKKIDKKKGK